jgi:hypothetical protein
LLLAMALRSAVALAVTPAAALLRLGLLLALLSVASASRRGAAVEKIETPTGAQARQLLAEDGEAAENTAVEAANSTVVRLRWRITLANVAPDCFERPALLVNGKLSPTIEVTQGDILEVGGAGLRLCRLQRR